MIGKIQYKCFSTPCSPRFGVYCPKHKVYCGVRIGKADIFLMWVESV